jgi:hypothetical protein
MRVFPAIIAYATHRLVVVATMLLLIPLVIFATLTAFVLVGNTYLNVCSAAVSSIVLMQSLAHRHESAARHAELQQRLDLHEAKLDALHAHLTRRRGGNPPSGK